MGSRRYHLMNAEGILRLETNENKSEFAIELG